MTQSKKALGSDPLDAVLGTVNALDQPVKMRKLRKVPSPATRKIRLTAHVPESVAERAKNAVYWTPGLTLAQLTQDALTRAVDALERKRRAAFPRRPEELKGGRPMKGKG